MFYIYIYIYDWFFLTGPLFRKIEKCRMNLPQEIKRLKDPYFRIMKKKLVHILIIFHVFSSKTGTKVIS